MKQHHNSCWWQRWSHLFYSGLGEVAATEFIKLGTERCFCIEAPLSIRDGKWDQAPLLGTVMQERVIHHEPGCSWIEVDNKLHHFAKQFIPLRSV